MDALDVKQQQTQSQYIGIFMVVFGTAAILLGCRFHFAELTTAAAGINGAGINMLTNQLRNSVTNKQGGTINVAGNGAGNGAEDGSDPQQKREN